MHILLRPSTCGSAHNSHCHVCMVTTTIPRSIGIGNPKVMHSYNKADNPTYYSRCNAHYSHIILNKNVVPIILKTILGLICQGLVVQCSTNARI